MQRDDDNFEWIDGKRILKGPVPEIHRHPQAAVVILRSKLKQKEPRLPLGEQTRDPPV
jgi:hypothetical protein